MVKFEVESAMTFWCAVFILLAARLSLGTQREGNMTASPRYHSGFGSGRQYLVLIPKKITMEPTGGRILIPRY
ncbi:hypothetical protein B0T19DRAFT_411101 [Cercophora scortea]|uniref:Secreted protein n=1 Tax=Cercophora scortea TaxID=314031 RepID=A0AAE0J4V2_9PEZI|nr:hypothetical protein B0T19DRAFT_411101 [Cercophora scortea]